MTDWPQPWPRLPRVHARIPDLNKPFGILVRLKQPIDFDAIDGEPVDLLFLLLLLVTSGSLSSMSNYLSS